MIENPKTLADFGLSPEDIRESNGNYRTGSLFYEFRRAGHRPLWSISDYDRVIDGVCYPSLKQIYMSYDDPTEYTFVMEVFGSWAVWERLNNSSKLVVAAFNKWRAEQEIKLRSKGIKGVIAEVGKGKSSLAASKFLVDRGWIQGQVGRPSKKKINDEAKKISRIHEELDDELTRAEEIIYNASK